MAVFTTTLICICFWVCFCIQIRRQSQRPYRYGTRAQAQPGSYPVQGRYVAPSTTTAGVNPPQTQQAYPRQGYVPPSTGHAGAVPSVSPLAASHPGAIPQATTAEPVSLPEATLHQGDAPPTYAEAIGMKTVDIAGQDKQQT